MDGPKEGSKRGTNRDHPRKATLTQSENQQRREGAEMAAAYSSHAKSPSVLLGYPDEDVSAAVDFTTNAIGGIPVSD